MLPLTATASEPRLELVSVSKSFAGTRALESVSLAVHAGEVHVVAGENGAGKSTLIRVIAGAIGDFSGELRLDGRSVRFASPAAAVAAGIATIHQELSLVPALSIADNFELARPGRALALRARRRSIPTSWSSVFPSPNGNSSKSRVHSRARCACS